GEKFSVPLRRKSPGDVRRHAILLHRRPGSRIAPKRAGAAKSAGKRVLRDGTKLYPRRPCCSGPLLVEIDDGVLEAADLRDNGNRAITKRAELRKSTGLESRGNHERVGSGLHQVSKILVVADHAGDRVRVSSRN